MPKINSQNAIVEIQAQREIGKKERKNPTRRQYGKNVKEKIHLIKHCVKGVNDLEEGSDCLGSEMGLERSCNMR